MPQQLLSLCNALCRRLWPSSQGKLADEVYLDLIEFMYSCRNTVLSGATAVSIVTITIAWSKDIPTLIGYILLIYMPFNILRYLQAVSYVRQTQQQKRATAALSEARYAILTLINCLGIALITLTVMSYGGQNAKYALTIVLAVNAVVSCIRNASIPRMAVLQCIILMAPAIIGLFLAPNILSKIIAMMIIPMTFSIREISMRVKKETIEVRELAARAQHIARHDTLTGLFNRHHLTELLNAKVTAGVAINALYMDLDNFKAINDTKGHPVGDKLLIAIADKLTTLVNHDTTEIARFGGDEFIILTKDNPVLLADAILEMFCIPFRIDDISLRIGCSIGINTSVMSSDPVDLIKNADIALYAAKAHKRNTYQIFDNAMAQTIRARSSLEEALKAAIDAKAITPHYQPIVDMKSGQIVAAEALARWRHPELGAIRPDIFIKVAEELGLIEQLGENILIQACTDAAKWTKPIIVAVNVSPLQFKNPDRLKEAIARALQISGLPGARLELEVTEGTMIDDFIVVRDTILEIKKMGVQLALDDFGSGCCSLSYLEQIPFDKIKIDRALTRAAMKSKTQQIVIQMVTKMAKELNAETVVEGIEDHAQAAQMVMFGATQAQGYLFGYPSADQSPYMSGTAIQQQRA